MKIAWVTSFNEALYRVSGLNLINSFKRRQRVGNLYVYHECSKKILRPKEHPSIRFQSISSHPFLVSFLEKNRDIIPKKLGGDYTRCKCMTRGTSPRDHKLGCPYHWFNKSVYRWFRKIVSLHECFKTVRDESFVIWLDCDVRFIRNIPLDFIEDRLFQDKDFFYIQGDREWPETGIFGFNLQRNGRKFWDLLRDQYVHGRFRNYERWDDCWQIKSLLEENPDITRCDILPSGCYGHVFRKSVLKDYLIHAKGQHGRRRAVWGWFE